MAETVTDFAKLIRRKIGISRAASTRIAVRLNNLAKSVDWATPLSEDGSEAKIRKGAKKSSASRTKSWKRGQRTAK